MLSALVEITIFVAEEIEQTHSYRQDIVAIASSYIGSLSMRYVSEHPELGQSAETGFDCSGFVRQVLLQAGLHIPDYIGMDDIRRPIRHASEFWDHYGVYVGAKPEAGDLIFFSRNGRMPTHVGIVRDEETYIHARGSNNTRVEIAPIVEEQIPSRNLSSRALYGVNPIGYKTPVVVHPHPTYRYHQQPAE